MECREAQELLSAYHDGELPTDVQSSVAKHAEGCSRCGGELATFGQLSTMARGMESPELPSGGWASLESVLDAGRANAPVVRPAMGQTSAAKKRRLGLLTAAALVLVSAGIVWISGKAWHAPGHHDAHAADFDQYLNEFAANPATAQNVLLASYNGRPVDLDEATRRLGYRPAIAAGLPEGYSVESMHMLDMPCCRCLQTLCRRDDGKQFAIFEHEEAQPVWFGNRPCVETQCNGRPCSVVEAGHGVVASWKAGERQLTVVGASDLEEIADLVTRFAPET